MIKYLIILLLFLFACNLRQQFLIDESISYPLQTHKDIKKEIKRIKEVKGKKIDEIQYLIFLDGTLYYEEGKFDQAFKMFEKAYSFEKNKIIGERLLHYYKEYAEQLLNKGSNDKALKYLQKYVQLNEELRSQ